MPDPITMVTLSDLPLNIQKQIPYSIRTYKNIYNINELPYDIKDIIEQYFLYKKDVQYDKVLDCVPQVSKYGDFKVINSVYDLVLEYLKNYLLVSPNQYPFDPLFGSRLKYYLQSRGTEVKRQLITAEIQNIANIISSDLEGMNIKIKSVEISDTSRSGMDIEFNCIIKLRINNQDSTINVGVPVEQTS